MSRRRRRVAACLAVGIALFGACAVGSAGPSATGTAPASGTVPATRPAAPVTRPAAPSHAGATGGVPSSPDRTHPGPTVSTTPAIASPGSSAPASSPSAGASPSPPGPTRPALDPATGLAPGLTAEVVLDDLHAPTAVRFGADGRMWVIEKSGTVSVGDADGGRRQRADLSERVLSLVNRGLLGLAPHPTDPAAAYVLYTFDGPVGGPYPRWRDDVERCTEPERTCPASGVLSLVRFEPGGGHTETVLVAGWCQHSRAHSVGDLAWGPDGDLYVSSGDGASGVVLDDGTLVPPEARCHPGAFASGLTPAERDPGAWNGTVVRIPGDVLRGVDAGTVAPEAVTATGEVVAIGLRNPFRTAFRPGSTELWITDPGWLDWEEIDVLPDATGDAVTDFGWPCREGFAVQPQYGLLGACAAERNRDHGATDPWFVYHHDDPVTPSDPCPAGSSSVSVVGFVGDAHLPVRLADALVFGDATRACGWAALAGDDGTPDPSRIVPLWSALSVTDAQVGPDGTLYVTDLGAGAIRRLRAAD